MTKRLYIMLLTLFALSAPLSACEDDKKQVLNNSNPKDEEQPDDDKLGHGTDKEVEDNATKPSNFQGVWRVVRTDADKTPVVRVSLIVDEGAKEGSGDFTAQAALGENFNGLTGTLIDVTTNTSDMSFTFNPTADSAEVYTVAATKKVDEDNFEGTFKSKTDTYNFEVKIIRVKFD